MNLDTGFKSIAFCGGGTGGHIYPGIAVIMNIRAAFNGGQDIRIFWIGSDSGLDRTILEKAGIEFYGIKSGKLRRYFSLQNFFDIFKIIAGCFSALKILKREKVNFLFSKGGFVSVPPVIAASFLHIPVWTHESDFSPGLATKINARFADKICTAYEKTAMYFNAANRLKILLCGNPVRPVFYSASPSKGKEFIKSIVEKKNGNVNLFEQKKIILVLGGSQGAKEINDLIKRCIDDLSQNFFVVHQTGNEKIDLAKKNYLSIQYIYEEMPDVLAAADLVIGRSGAGTVWESAAIGLPMILIPLCGSGTRGDQVENAKYFDDHGAAIMLLHPAAKDLCEKATALLKDESKLQSMAQKSKEIGRLNGAKIIADAIIHALRG
ncbi:MAG: undecaprenyldiphospho-muramoylpentapeptide beta-N-acetylglucosaminyltransferase [Termitinemataceae bacterium]|nr:MAG: undecaprenyldiphospho-muramoylpentapeptide beta-N-acetylglucosaminyltransferase [Termitinemataceae bacterium]